MIPSAAYELLSGDSELVALGVTPSRIKELQTVDERPFDSGYFIIFNWQEQDFVHSVQTGPRNVLIWVHTPLDRSRNYRPIDQILNRIDQIFNEVEQVTGTDGVRMTAVRKMGRSANLMDEGWKTITRFATYSVLYDEAAA